MDRETEQAEQDEFGRLVAEGVIVYLPATPEAMRSRGWVDDTQPDGPEPVR